MSDFQTMVSMCMARIDNRNDRVEPYVKETIVRHLRDLSHHRLRWMEGTFSFTTTADQVEYGAGYTNFPLDIAVIDSLRRGDVGESVAEKELVGPYDVSDLRRASTAQSGAIPKYWGFHHEKLILSPGCGYALLVQGDYHRDATRDTATGNVITSASTTHTNPWFVEGQSILMNFVLADVHSGLMKDAEASTLALGLAQVSLNRMQEARKARQDVGGQSAWYF